MSAAATDNRRTRRVHPAFLAAFEKLGYIVTDWNLHLLSDEQVDEWETALDDWVADHPDDDPP